MSPQKERALAWWGIILFLTLFWVSIAILVWWGIGHADPGIWQSPDLPTIQTPPGDEREGSILLVAPKTDGKGCPETSVIIFRHNQSTGESTEYRVTPLGEGSILVQPAR